MDEFLATFNGFHQTIFSFLAVHSPQQLFSQLTAHSSFFTTIAQPNRPLVFKVYYDLLEEHSLK
jgi:hypothetical protein